MKNLIILHGMSCYLEECWLNSILENKVLSKKFNFIVPHFPLEKEITFEKWDDLFAQYMPNIDENTTIIAHSLSTLFIIRFLYKHQLKINKLICVGGGYAKGAPGALKYLSAFIPQDVEFDYARQNIPHRYHIFSDNDHIWSPEHIEAYNSLLNPIEIKTHNCGHYGRTSKVKVIPEIFEIL